MSWIGHWLITKRLAVQKNTNTEKRKFNISVSRGIQINKFFKWSRL